MKTVYLIRPILRWKLYFFFVVGESVAPVYNQAKKLEGQDRFPVGEAALV